MNSFKNHERKDSLSLCFVCFALSCALCEKTPETVNTLRDDEKDEDEDFDVVETRRRIISILRGGAGWYAFLSFFLFLSSSSKNR